jgi:phosphatidylinositol-bisphosphatase
MSTLFLVCFSLLPTTFSTFSMSNALADIRELLRSTDEVKAVLEATLIPNPSDAEPDEDAGNKRILAVISHKDDWDLIEEGWYAS